MTTTLPEHLTQRGGSPDLLAGELIDRITCAISAHPRSQQAAIGPSEIGNPCGKEIAAKLLGHPDRQRPGEGWKMALGTAAHAWLEGVFDIDNLNWEKLNQAGNERWYVETRVDVGSYDGISVVGSCDLYDRVTATVLDWKCVGPTQLRKYKTNGPGAQYRAQAHLYGRGWRRLGLPADTVMVAFLPRDGELRDAYFWHEPYNEQIALDALQRLEGIALTVKTLGEGAIAATPCHADPCYYCPRPGQAQPFSELIA